MAERSALAESEWRALADQFEIVPQEVQNARLLYNITHKTLIETEEAFWKVAPSGPDRHGARGRGRVGLRIRATYRCVRGAVARGSTALDERGNSPSRPFAVATSSDDEQLVTEHEASRNERTATCGALACFGHGAPVTIARANSLLDAVQTWHVVPKRKTSLSKISNVARSAGTFGLVFAYKTPHAFRPAL
jgi:hypothetical protein